MDIAGHIQEFFAKLRGNPSWPVGYGHEGWLAVELAAYLGAHGFQCVREAPYVIDEAPGVAEADPSSGDAPPQAPTESGRVRYADVYACYGAALLMGSKAGWVMGIAQGERVVRAGDGHRAA